MSYSLIFLILNHDIFIYSRCTACTSCLLNPCVPFTSVHSDLEQQEKKKLSTVKSLIGLTVCIMVMLPCANLSISNQFYTVKDNVY